MASFNEAFKRFKGIEFNNPKNVLHKNKGEDGLTFYGIYQSAHPTWNGWDDIKGYLKTHKGNMKRASMRAYYDERLIEEVKRFYKILYWDTLRLDEVDSQKIAEEMFFFYVNIGNKKKVVKFAQSIAGAKPDGIIGRMTLKALNSFDEDIFDKEYDRKEISHYKRLVRYYPKRFGIFLKGWINRARII